MSFAADTQSLITELHDLREIVQLAHTLRKAQREYFVTRDKEVLRQCKALEKRFDTLLAAIDTKQPNLFSHEH